MRNRQRPSDLQTEGITQALRHLIIAQGLGPRFGAVALFFTMASARPTRTRTPVRGYGFDVLNSEDSASEDDFEADKSI